MSFKRDGNDSNLLKNLQHRRVIDILGDHIPNDEASLLSNGRITCTVCSKRPIFDTIPMLSLHRKGKKHLLELSIYLEHKRELENKRNKERQKSFLKTNQITIEPDTTPYIAFAACPQNYGKSKRYGSLSNRKYVLDITESCDRIKSSLNPPIAFETSANSQVRKYLKSLFRKQPLEKTVRRLQENYGHKTSQNKISTSEKTEIKKSVEKKSFENSKQKVDHCIKLLESGWIQDANGKWIKDPNVEFDSDEEEPPFCLDK